MRVAGRILLVDDEPATLDLLCASLEAEGWTVVVATSGPAAIAAARRSHPDLVVLDVGLPGLDGFATCRRLEHDPATADTPIVFLSAMDPVAGARRASEAGGSGFIEKRPPWAAIVRRIRCHMEGGIRRTSPVSRPPRLGGAVRRGPPEPV